MKSDLISFFFKFLSILPDWSAKCSHVLRVYFLSNSAPVASAFADQFTA